MTVLEEAAKSLDQLCAEISAVPLEAENEISDAQSESWDSRMNGFITAVISLMDQSPRFKLLMGHEVNGATQILSSHIQLFHLCRKHFLKDERNSFSLAEVQKVVRERLWVVLNGIDSLKFWAEDTDIDMSEVSLRSFFEEARVPLSCIFKKKSGKMLDLTLDDATQEVFMHRGTVAMLLVNAIKNAQKHGKADRIVITTSDRGENLCIAVSDNGKGVKEAIAEQIFEFGFSGGDSSGLGLADAKKRMSMMGGSIECIPHGGMDGGARFDLTLLKSETIHPKTEK